MGGSSLTPPWPSLYNVFIEIDHIANRPPIEPTGFYLDDPGGKQYTIGALGNDLLNLCSWIPDVYRFTLYWTLVFYTPAFMLCGTYAFINLAFTPESRVRKLLLLSPPKYSAVPTRNDIQLNFIHKTPSHLGDDTHTMPGRARVRMNERRSRLTFALIVLFVFACGALGGAVVGSAVLGYVMAGVFKVAHYHMST
jgi:hypothetical protein